MLHTAIVTAITVVLQSTNQENGSKPMWSLLEKHHKIIGSRRDSRLGI